jgi:glycosyltransferase involved in cell wall biosynthesis
MKPLLVSLEYPPHSFGGVGSHVFNLARCLVERGVRCAVLSPGPGESESTSGGVTHFTTPISEAAGFKLLSFAARVPGCLDRVRRSFDFDIVHSHFSPCAFVGRRSLGGARLVETAHGTHWGELAALSPLSRLTPREVVGKYTVYPVLSLLDLLCYRKASAIIAVSPLARTEVSRYGRGFLDKTVVIPNGIVLSEFGPAAPRPRRGDAALRCLCVAFMQARKGLEYLLEACALLAADGALVAAGDPGGGAGVGVTIVGDGPHFLRLKAKARDLGVSDLVRFAGRLDRTSLRQEFASADAFVLPSLWEGQGIVFLEAMAAGLPIVATRIPGVEGTLEHGANALLVPPRDSAALARAMLELARDPELRARLASEGLARVKRYDWNQLVEEVVSLYASVLGGRV